MKLLQEIETFVFDMDGTLIERMSYEQLLDNVSRTIEVSFEHLFARYQATWLGFEEAQRWHQSLAKPHQLASLQTVYDDFYAHLMNPRIIEGVNDILARIQYAGKRLICWTGGDEEKQKRVLHISGLAPYFDDVLVTSLKNTQIVAQQLLPIMSTGPFAMIGDSYTRDIASVIGYAQIAFWIMESDANRFLQSPISLDPGVIAIKRIRDLSDYL